MFVEDSGHCDSYAFFSRGPGQFADTNHRVFLFEDNRRSDGHT
jgi:hypothetical protein